VRLSISLASLEGFEPPTRCLEGMPLSTARHGTDTPERNASSYHLETGAGFAGKTDDGGATRGQSAYCILAPCVLEEETRSLGLFAWSVPRVPPFCKGRGTLEGIARHRCTYSGAHAGQPSSPGFSRQVFLAMSDRSPIVSRPSLLTS